MVKCFFPTRGLATQRSNQFKLNGEFGGWTLIAKGGITAGETLRGNPISEASEEQRGHIFGPPKDYYWIGFHNALYLTSLYSHKEKMALKINIKRKKNVDSYRGSPLQELRYFS